ncbi:MAG: putative ABC transport system permease protein [Rhodobacteraceae bacterium HLUCCA08]|nr:MAG: putative ABC transport system permease protein [Rhodobacteraceae bacterium HLUCCA08]
MNALFLAFAYLRHNWARALILVVAGALILSVPVVARMLIGATQDSLTARAKATPLILGARGSQLDLAMGALYFTDDRAEPVTMQAAEDVWDSGLAVPIPLLTAFRTGEAPIVGTSLDYVEFRGLEIAQGRMFAVLGEAVLGAGIAAQLGLGPGDTVISSPENLFDLDGVYPLELRITGVLAPSGTPDDDAVLTDIKTTWVIAGIGHGHDDVVTPDADGNVTADAALVQFNRITPDNIDSFHFHGDPDDYPVSAVLLDPHDDRSALILRGRYLDPDSPTRIVRPDAVIGELVERIFRIRSLLDAVMVIVGASALAAMGLALFLAWRLRAPEMQTAFRIGAGRLAIARLAAAEIALLLVAMLALAAGIVLVVTSRGDGLVAWLLALGR